MPQSTQYLDAKAIEPTVELATMAQRAHATTPSHVRSDWLSAAANLVLKDAERFANLIVKEGVKTITEARSEVARAVRVLRLSADETTRREGSVIDFGQEARAVGKIGWVSYKPKGTILGITPFNDPLNLVAHKVGPALAAGNSVIIKPHPQTPGCAEALADVFRRSGLPDGLFQVICGGSDIGAALVRHPDISMVSFTGGAVAGQEIARDAAGKSIGLELGGVAVTIVSDDADLSLAIPSLVSGMFAAAGQNCLHVQRVIAHEAIYDRLADGLKSATERLRLGSRTDSSTEFGRMIHSDAAARCTDWVKEAVDGGARVLTGGERLEDGFAPTILEDVPADARLRTDEVFGPVTSLECYSKIETAIEMAGASGPALAAAVFTRSLSIPFKLQQLAVGQIVVNDTTDFRIDAMPFGGPSGSGLGREGIRSAIDAMSEEQVMCIAP